MRERLADRLRAFGEGILRDAKRSRRQRWTGETGLIDLIIVALVLAVVSIALSELLRPKPKFEQARPASLGDFQFPTAVEGRVIPILWGTVKINGPNVVWYGDLTQVKIKKTIKTGLFSSKSITTGFKYFVGIQFALCRGPIDRLSRIWIGDKLVASSFLSEGIITISQPKLFGGDELGSGGVEGSVVLHPGTETQDTNDYLEALIPDLPAYRGTCYCVFQRGYIGNSTSIKPWSFEVRRFPNQLEADEPVVNEFDSNPACVIYELLTDGDWGFGFDDSDVNLDNFRAVAQTLFEEGNGWSFILDGQREAADLLHEIERQIDGVVYLNQRTGKYEISLMRDDFDIGTAPQLNETNVLEVKEFSRGTWEGTANQVRVSFNDRDHEYTETFAQGHDLANLRIQGGEMVSVTNVYPGIKNRTLANQVAARDTRALTTPLARATLVVNRTMWELKPGDVVAWSWESKGINQIPMRVNKVDMGDMLDGKIELTLVQDVFAFTEGMDGDPDPTDWVAPTQDVEAFPEDEQVVMEAPRGFVTRDDGVPDRVWAGARRQASEVQANIWTRHDPVDPSGEEYALDGQITDLFLIGELGEDVPAGPDNPTLTFQVLGNPDLVTDIVAAFDAGASVADLGLSLTNLVLVDDEFMLVTEATDETTHLELNGVYRGVLDSVPAAHLEGAKVYLLHAGGSMTDGSFPPGDLVDVQLRGESPTDVIEEGEATTVQVTMDNRYRRPYPPTALEINGEPWPDEIDFDENA